MAATVTSRLYMIFGLDSGKNLSVSIADPKANLTRAQVEPVMQSIVDKDIFLYKGAHCVSVVDAYVKEVSTTEII